MKNKLFLLFFSFVTLSIYAQVETKLFPQRNAFDQVKVIKDHSRVNKLKQMPSFDVQKLIAEDKSNERLDVPFRFGKGFDTNITLTDGEWIDVENGRLWSMDFQSKDAYSINFVFDGFYLPDGAKLYIINKTGTVLYGPITSKQNTKNGYFLTDLIDGDEVSMFIFEPISKKGQTQLNIKRVIHAYKNLFLNKTNGNFGASGSCNNDVVCFPDWEMESDAVALVLLSNGAELCSGSLLVTANYNFIPYFLSAFHCIDSSKDGSLSSAEISDAENWMFKFQYKKTACNGNSATTGITFNGARFRSAWNASDFVLMEMDNSPSNNVGFSWLGWDRSGNNPINATGIHHPSGDVMKI
jgi:hypothetical protein